MADTKISALTASAGGTDAMILPVVQSGANKGLTGSQLASYVASKVAVAQSAIAASVTGTVSVTTLATIVIPGGTIGANGRVEIDAVWSVTNSANNKILNIAFGGTNFFRSTVTATASYNSFTRISNRNSASSQVGGAVANSYGSTTAAVATGAIDTTADVTILITGALANTGETITLESYAVKVFPKA